MKINPRPTFPNKFPKLRSRKGLPEDSVALRLSGDALGIGMASLGFGHMIAPMVDGRFEFALLGPALLLAGTLVSFLPHLLPVPEVSPDPQPWREPPGAEKRAACVAAGDEIKDLSQELGRPVPPNVEDWTRLYREGPAQLAETHRQEDELAARASTSLLPANLSVEERNAALFSMMGAMVVLAVGCLAAPSGPGVPILGLIGVMAGSVGMGTLCEGDAQTRLNEAHALWPARNQLKREAERLEDLLGPFHLDQNREALTGLAASLRQEVELKRLASGGQRARSVEEHSSAVSIGGVRLKKRR